MLSEINSKYNYPHVLQWLENKGQEIYGPQFKISANDQPIILKLMAYFLNDESTCLQLDIDLNKGILLAGPIGCGKTTLMNLMKYITAAENKYFLKPCREISFEFIQDGYEIIHKYAKGQLYQADYRIYCFDDLGLENNLKYYGNACNVMAEILLSRYDYFISKKLKTHLTTNLSASEIETQYGNRVRSRMRQMFNLVAFDKETRDKR
jgi:energy-coupling factor transporter ATP-binding protein EcfA2